jgi:hypothetical protein
MLAVKQKQTNRTIQSLLFPLRHQSQPYRLQLLLLLQLPLLAPLLHLLHLEKAHPSATRRLYYQVGREAERGREGKREKEREKEGEREGGYLSTFTDCNYCYYRRRRKLNFGLKVRGIGRGEGRGGEKRREGREGEEKGRT